MLSLSVFLSLSVCTLLEAAGSECVCVGRIVGRVRNRQTVTAAAVVEAVEAELANSPSAAGIYFSSVCLSVCSSLTALLLSFSVLLAALRLITVAIAKREKEK